MKQMNLKILSYLLAIVMLLGMIPTVAVEAIAEEVAVATDTTASEEIKVEQTETEQKAE